MKKIISIIAIIFLLALCFNINTVNAQAVQPTYYMANLNYSSERVDNKIIMTVSLGEFTETEAPTPVSEVDTLQLVPEYTGYAIGELTYIDSHFTDVDIKGLNGWYAYIDQDGKTFTMMTSEPIEENTDIVEITFTLNTDVEEKVEGNILLNVQMAGLYEGAEVSGVYVFDQKEGNEPYLIEPATEEPEPEVNTIQPENTVEEPQNKVDNTVVPDKELPQTGVDIAITVAIIGLIVVSIIGFIKYRKSNIK